ncbi:MAG: hypothetical protein SW833_19290 [Cyanobacteriota bacterium]|nr:hypothetical protein [Cyanobacteriota bacterium]
MVKIIDPNTSYTFSKLFELKIPADELAWEFGYTLSQKRIGLPQYPGNLDRLEELRSRIEEVLPYVDLSNETSRREILISQIATELVHYTKAQLRIEYPIAVTQQLQGYLDYLFRSQTDLLVIEAKRQDLDYGMTQLVAEMIALDLWDRTPEQKTLLGSVTTGKIWEFALLHRTEKHIDRGLESYRVPEDIDPLMRILVQALTTNSKQRSGV